MFWVIDELNEIPNVLLDNTVEEQKLLTNILDDGLFDIMLKFPLLEEYIFTNESFSQCNNIIIVIMVLRIRLGYKIKQQHLLFSTIMDFPEYIIPNNIPIIELQELLNECIYISLLIFQENNNLTQNQKLKLMTKMCKYVVNC